MVEVAVAAVEAAVAAAGGAVVSAPVDGLAVGVRVARLDVESGDGLVSVGACFVEQVDEVGARAAVVVEVFLDEGSAFVFVSCSQFGDFACAGASDEHHVGDESLRPNALREGEEGENEEK